jgi:hypothetical protein
VPASTDALDSPAPSTDAASTGSVRAAWWDAALYGVSALVAALAARFDYIPLQRTWGRLALGPYAVGAVLAALLALSWRRRPPTDGIAPPARVLGRRPLRARTVLAVAVLLGAMAVPLGLEVAWRAHDGDRLHVQSEIFLTEQGSRVLLHGGDPYRTTYHYGLLRTYPPGVWEHIPYLPAVFAFGLPRAVLGASSGPLTDARLWFTAVAVAVALLAVALSGASGERRLRLLMVLLVLPTGARYLTGGGDDVAVLALLLLAVVLEHRGRPVAGGVAAGLAAAIKQTAWLPLPFLALAAHDRAGNRATGRYLAAVGGVVVPVVAPFAVWDLRRLLDSVVLYPLGLSSHPTIARGPTLGRLLAAPFPHGKGVVAAVVAVMVVGVALLVLIRWTPRDVPTACRQAGVVFALAVVLATAGRPGYLIYPVNLLVWSWLLPEHPAPHWRGRRERAAAAQP